MLLPRATARTAAARKPPAQIPPALRGLATSRQALNIKRFPDRKKGSEGRVLSNAVNPDPPVGDYAKPLPAAAATEWSGGAAQRMTARETVLLPSDFLEAIGPDELAKTLRQHADLLGRPALLLRQPAIDLVQFLAAHGEASSNEPLRIALTGPALAGKTASLYLAVSNLQQRGWLVLFAPSLWRWVSGWHRYEPANADGTEFAQNELAAAFLQSVLAFNQRSGALAATTLSPEGHKAIGATSDGATLETVAKQGAENPREAQKCVRLILSELGRPDRGGPPALVAVDQVNALYTPTWYRDREGSMLLPHQLQFVREWQRLVNGQTPLSRGAILVAETRSLAQTRSPFWDWAAAETLTTPPAPLRHTAAAGSQRLVPPPRSLDLHKTSPFGVVTGDAAAQSPYFDASADFKPDPRTFRVAVPHADKLECQAWMQWLEQAGRLNVPLTSGWLERTWTTSGGVLGRFHRDVTFSFH